MAGIPRPPRTSGRLYRSVARRYGWATGPAIRRSEFTPKAMPGFTLTAQSCETSFRSPYVKGSLITLPGGSKFLKSTSYSTWSASIPDSIGAYTGDLWRPISSTHHDNRRCEDEGRDIGILINSPVFRFGASINQDARNEAVTKALNKIADQKVNLGENLATLGQTMRLFTDKASLLLDALKYARRVKSWDKLLSKSARDLYRAGPLTVTAQQYLAYIYGLKPLVSDVYTLSQLLKAAGVKTLLLSGEGSAFRSAGIRTTGNWNFYSYSKIRLLSGAYSTKVKCKIWARINPDYAGTRALNQLGLLNPLGLAWDLVPYSFVVDWFLPVGPVLYAMSAPAGLIFVDGYVSARTSEVDTFEYATSAVGFDFDRDKGPTGPSVEQKLIVPRSFEGYARESLASWPRPALWFDTDPFRGDRPLKALALSIVALSGSRSPIR